MTENPTVPPGGQPRDAGGTPDTAVEVRFFAAAREAAGTGLTVVRAATITELVAVLEQEHGPDLARVLARSSLLIDGVVHRPGEPDVDPGLGRGPVDVLPPFAGG